MGVEKRISTRPLQPMIPKNWSIKGPVLPFVSWWYWAISVTMWPRDILSNSISSIITQRSSTISPASLTSVCSGSLPESSNTSKWSLSSESSKSWFTNTGSAERLVSKMIWSSNVTLKHRSGPEAAALNDSEEKFSSSTKKWQFQKGVHGEIFD